ncbi:MAG: hypothetical protein WCJ60_02250 [bacterium]
MTQQTLSLAKPSQGTRIIRALKIAGNQGITSTDMIVMGIYKYSSRIAELRQDGWNVVATRIKGSLWQYHLIEEREEAERG